MTIQDEQELIRLLGLFFSETDWGNRNVLYRNKVVSLLREKLTKLGRWKNLPRGNKKKKGNTIQGFASQFIAKKNDKECPF